MVMVDGPAIENEIKSSLNCKKHDRINFETDEINFEKLILQSHLLFKG